MHMDMFEHFHHPGFSRDKCYENQNTAGDKLLKKLYKNVQCTKFCTKHFYTEIIILLLVSSSP